MCGEKTYRTGIDFPDEGIPCSEVGGAGGRKDPGRKEHKSNNTNPQDPCSERSICVLAQLQIQYELSEDEVPTDVVVWYQHIYKHKLNTYTHSEGKA